MARKKITSLVGKDPVYSKEFADRPSIAAPAPTADPKPVIKPEPVVPETPKRDTKTPKRASTPKAKPAAKAEKPATRAVHVRAAPKTEHKAGLDALEKAGLPAPDVVRLAGKRAMAKFTLTPKYVAPQKADRLPSEMSFRTMKTLDGKTLDALRDHADPLRLRSDAAVIQGQLEPVFWQELDAAIIELRKKYA